MTPTLAGIATTFGGWLVHTSLQASVVILLVFAVRWLLGRWLTPRWHYALWLLVMLRLALPVVPASPTSVFNLTPRWPMAGTPAEQRAPPEERSALDPAPAAEIAVLAASPPRDADFHVPSLLLTLWALVALGLFARVARHGYRLSAGVCRQRPVTLPDVIETLEDCKLAMGVHIPINVVQSSEVTTPALLGFLRPRLLLPERLLESLDGDALRQVFLHELAHVKRRDILFSWLSTFLHVLHWFNPLVTLAVASMRADRELATDSLVLSRSPSDANRPYGEALLRLLEFGVQRDVVPGTVGVLEDKSELKRRITMIATHRQGAYRPSLLAAGVLVALSAVALTGAVSAADESGQLAPQVPSMLIDLKLELWHGPVDVGGPQAGPIKLTAREGEMAAFRTGGPQGEVHVGLLASVREEFVTVEVFQLAEDGSRQVLSMHSGRVGVAMDASLTTTAGVAATMRIVPTLVRDGGPMARLTGQVADDSGGLLTEAAITALDTAGHEYPVRSTGSGTYTIEVPPGTYLVEAKAGDLAAVAGPLDILPGQTAVTDLALARQTDIHLRFGSPLSRQDLTAWVAGSGSADPAWRDLMSTVARTMSDFVWLESVDLAGGIVTLRGVAAGHDRVTQFAGDLKEGGALRGVDIRHTQATRGSRLAFELVATWDDPARD